MRNNSWIALIVVFGIIGWAMMSATLFITLRTPDGERIEGSLFTLAEGNNITITGDDANNSVTIAAASAYSTIQDQGVALTQRSTINMTGLAVTCNDTGILTQCLIEPWPVVTVCPSNAVSGRFCDYTADGTGDFVEIQAAIDGCPSNGCEVFLSAGQFNLGSTGITINKPIILIGEGSQATTLVSTSVIDFITVTDTRTTIQNLRLNGFGASNPTSGIYVHGGRVVVTNVSIQSFAANPCIKADNGSTFNYFTNIRIVNCKIGVQLLSTANANVISNSNITTNVANAILLDVQAQQAKVYGIDFEGLQASTVGISVDVANSELAIYGGRFESLLTGIDWSAGDYDQIYGTTFATTTTFLNNPPDTTLFLSNAAGLQEFRFPLDCSTYANGGTITTTGSAVTQFTTGVLTCSDDDT